MNGLRAATLLVGMMLLAPHGASAQSCMCAETGLELPLSEADAALLEDAIASFGEQVVLAQPIVDSEDLPWCTNQNDPQCSKRPAGAVPSFVSLEVSPPLSVSAPLALPAPSSVDCDFAEYSCGGPRDAMRSKLERPPQ